MYFSLASVVTSNVYDRNPASNRSCLTLDHNLQPTALKLDQGRVSAERVSARVPVPSALLDPRDGTSPGTTTLEVQDGPGLDLLAAISDLFSGLGDLLEAWIRPAR